MPFPNEHSARLRDPGEFAKEAKWRSGSPGQFRRTASTTIFGRINIPAGISVIWGKLKGKAGANDPPVPQALRFKKGKWTEKAAKRWLTENKLNERMKTFEPAADDNADEELDTFDLDDIEMPGARLTMKDIEGMSDAELGAMMRKTLAEQMKRKRIVITAYEDDDMPEVIEEADLSLEFEELIPDEETVESEPTDAITLTDILTPDDYAHTETSRWIPIFKVGKWKGTPFSLEDLKHIAKNFFKFKNKVTPALKLGHGGESGQPAAGWVKSLKVVGDILMAQFMQVPRKINQKVREGKYKRISAEIYKDLEIDGKKHGLALAGVALLGADPPAVKDLPPLESLYNSNTALYLLTYDESGEIAEITEYDEEAIEMPEDKTDVEEVVETPVEETPDEETPAEETPAEEDTPAEETPAAPMLDEATVARIARLEKLVETSTATIAKQQTAMDTQKDEARHEREETFMEGLKRDGKLIPAQDERIQHIFNALAVDATMIKLSETDEAGVVTEHEESIYEVFQSFLTGLPVALDYSERALDTDKQTGVTKADKDKYGLGDFKNDRGNYEITGTEIDKLVETYMKENPTVNMEDALVEVVLSHPELAV